MQSFNFYVEVLDKNHNLIRNHAMLMLIDNEHPFCKKPSPTITNQYTQSIDTKLPIPELQKGCVHVIDAWAEKHWNFEKSWDNEFAKMFTRWVSASGQEQLKKADNVIEIHVSPW